MSEKSKSRTFQVHNSCIGTAAEAIGFVFEGPFGKVAAAAAVAGSTYREFGHYGRRRWMDGINGWRGGATFKTVFFGTAGEYTC